MSQYYKQLKEHCQILALQPHVVHVLKGEICHIPNLPRKENVRALLSEQITWYLMA